jgi:hypothetical protein
VVLPKDMGLGDSMAVIEDELRKSLGKEHLFEAIVTKLSVANPDDREKMRASLSNALLKRDKTKFKDYVARAVGVTAEKTVEAVINKIFL